MFLNIADLWSFVDIKYYSFIYSDLGQFKRPTAVIETYNLTRQKKIV